MEQQSSPDVLSWPAPSSPPRWCYNGSKPSLLSCRNPKAPSAGKTNSHFTSQCTAVSCLDDREQLVLFCGLKGEARGTGAGRPHGMFQRDPHVCAHIFRTRWTPNTDHRSAQTAQEKHGSVSRIGKNERRPRWTLPHGHVINIAVPKWLCSAPGVLVPQQDTAPRKAPRRRQEHSDGSRQTLRPAYRSATRSEAAGPLLSQPRTPLAETGMKYSICFLCRRHAYWKHSRGAGSGHSSVTMQMSGRQWENSQTKTRFHRTRL